MIFYPKFYQIYILFKLKVYNNFYFNFLPLEKNSKLKISSDSKNFSQGVPQEHKLHNLIIKKIHILTTTTIRKHANT